MSEPTIDEMLAWLDSEVDSFSTRDNYARNMQAIRAILEQHRYPFGVTNTLAFRREVALEAVRAFVERVEKRLPDYNTGKGADSWLKAYRLAVFDELAKMEQETK